MAKDFGYSIGQRVQIIACDKMAIVQAILFNSEGTQYQVSYWDDSVRRIEWVYGQEIMSVQKVSTVIRQAK